MDVEEILALDAPAAGIDSTVAIPDLALVEPVQEI